MTVADLLDDKQNVLTTAQRRAMKYIVDHCEESAFLTTAELSKKAGVSEATIVRLARALGLGGYPDLQRILRQEIQGRLSTVDRLAQAIRHAHDGSDICTQVLQQDIENISHTMRNISPEVFQRAVTEIDEAKRIYVAGLRGAHAPALIIGLYLRFLEKDVQLLVPGYGDVWNNLYGVGAGDLVIGISLPRYTRLTIEILEYARRHGASVGTITDSIMSPLAAYADWVLPVSCTLESFIESFTASVSVANALVTAVSIRNSVKTMDVLRDREKLWQEKRIYVVDALPAHSKKQ